MKGCTSVTPEWLPVCVKIRLGRVVKGKYAHKAGQVLTWTRDGESEPGVGLRQCAAPEIHRVGLCGGRSRLEGMVDGKKGRQEPWRGQGGKERP